MWTTSSAASDETFHQYETFPFRRLTTKLHPRLPFLFRFNLTNLNVASDNKVITVTTFSLLCKSGGITTVAGKHRVVYEESKSIASASEIMTVGFRNNKSNSNDPRCDLCYIDIQGNNDQHW